MCGKTHSQHYNTVADQFLEDNLDFNRERERERLCYQSPTYGTIAALVVTKREQITAVVNTPSICFWLVRPCGICFLKTGGGWGWWQRKVAPPLTKLCRCIEWTAILAGPHSPTQRCCSLPAAYRCHVLEHSSTGACRRYACCLFSTPRAPATSPGRTLAGQLSSSHSCLCFHVCALYFMNL